MFSYLSKIGSLFKLFSGDAIFLITLVVLFLALGLYIGKGKLVSLILSFYPTTLLFNTFPFMSRAVLLHGDKLVVCNKLAIFLLFFIPINIIVDRYVFAESFGSSTSNALKVAGLALAVTILLVLFSYTTINYDVFHNFSAQIDLLFSTPARLFYWNLVPIVLLATL